MDKKAIETLSVNAVRAIPHRKKCQIPPSVI